MSFFSVLSAGCKRELLIYFSCTFVNFIIQMCLGTVDRKLQPSNFSSSIFKNLICGVALLWKVTFIPPFILNSTFHYLPILTEGNCRADS